MSEMSYEARSAYKCSALLSLCGSRDKVHSLERDELRSTLSWMPHVFHCSSGKAHRMETLQVGR